MVRFCSKLPPVAPNLSASGRSRPFLSEIPTNSFKSPLSQIRLRAEVLNAICIHHLRRCQLRISTAAPWRNLPLNHPPRRPPSSALFCLKLKPRCSQERHTNKSGNGSPRRASISPAKRFADSFVAHAKERAYPPRWAGKGPTSPNCPPSKLRLAWNTIRWSISEKWRRPGRVFIIEARKI
jgi:hypothetical protein